MKFVTSLMSMKNFGPCTV